MTRRISRRRLLHGLGLILLVGLLVPFLLYAVPGAIGADASHVVLSGSMAPAIEAGDVVIVRDVEAGTIEEGDIITFDTPTGGLPTTHRVTKVLGTGADRTFRTKGDANEDPDPQQISPADVNGQVILTLPYIGHVILFATTPLGLIIFLGLPFGLLIVSEAWLFAKEAGRDAADPTEPAAPRRLSGRTHDGADAIGSLLSGPLPTPSSDHPTAADSRADERSAPNSDTGTRTITLATDDLRLSLLITGLFLAYAVYMVYQQWIVVGQRSPVPVAVAVGTLGTFAIVGGLFLGTKTGADSDETDSRVADRPRGQRRIRAPASPSTPALTNRHPLASEDDEEPDLARDGGGRQPGTARLRPDNDDGTGDVTVRGPRGDER